MGLLEFLERGGLPDGSGLSEAACRLGAAVLQSAESLADVLETEVPEALSSFDGESLRKLGEAHRAWRRWVEALDEIDEEDLREWAGEHTCRPEQARFLAELDPSVEEAPKMLELFLKALEPSRNQAYIKISSAYGFDAGARGRSADDPYEDIRDRRFSLAEIGPARWVLVLKGRAERALTFQIAPNIAAIRPVFEGEDDDLMAVVERDIAPTLPEALEGLLDEATLTSVVESAASQYLSLLRARPAKAERMAAVYVGRARDPLGVVLLAGDGRLDKHTVIHAGPDWGKRFEAFLREQTPDQIVLPSDGPAPRLLQDVGRRVPPRMSTCRVRRAALDLARRTLKAIPEDLPPVVQAAVALGRRAIDPAREWGRLDPADIPLVSHQDLVPTAWLAEALNEVRLTRLVSGPTRLPRAAAKSPSSPTEASTAAGSAGASSGSANRRRVIVEAPRARSGRGRGSLGRRKVEVIGEDVEVKSLQDLRPGLHVRGTVTNTSRFGAFVAVGLQEEGLIHVSELADHFVADPGEVVTIGQEIIALVIQVDADRKRVSLSLKDVNPSVVASAPPAPSTGTNDAGSPMPAGSPGAPAGGDVGGPRTGVPQSRSQALAELNRLFKEDR